MDVINDRREAGPSALTSGKPVDNGKLFCSLLRTCNMYTNKSRLQFLAPLVIFIVLAVFLWRGLSLDPRQLPSPLINKPVPTFKLITLEDAQQNFSNKNLLGHVSLVNVWATWCITCQVEHPILMDIAHASPIPIYAIDYKDDRATALKWLQSHGNPYKMVGFDGDGKVSINWGVYGTPETFVVDKKGIIRYKLIGVLTPEVWQHEILPLIDKL